MFIAWGPELTFLYNDAYAEILGDKHPGALGRPFQQVWWDIWDDIKPLVDRALADEATWSENLPLTMNRRGFLEETWWTFSYSPVRDDDGRIGGMFCSCLETTIQVLAERQNTEQRQRLFELSRDLFGVATTDGYLKSVNPAWSHVLGRTEEELLTRPFSEIIHPDDLGTTAEVVAALARGEAAHQFHVRLLKADGEAIAFAWSAVPDAASASGIFYTVGRDITEELRRDEMLRHSQKMDAMGQLTGVNGRDAMPEGGVLTIHVGLETFHHQHGSELRPGRYLQLCVHDTGVGMDEATRVKATEPFFSTKGIGRGTGLGLSMVHGLAAQLGGALSLESAPGEGTTVKIWLPLSGADPTALASAAESAPGPHSGTVLLVDDETLVRSSTADMLADLGYRVVEAESAAQALRKLDEEIEIQILVTDHLMPEMTGAELVVAARRRHPGLHCLIVSGYAEESGISADFVRLTKPFRQAELAEKLAGLAAGLEN